MPGAKLKDAAREATEENREPKRVDDTNADEDRKIRSERKAG